MQRAAKQSAVAVWLVVSACACSSLDNCPEGQAAITVGGGKTDAMALTYDSAPGGREWHAFPAKTVLRFEHDLGQVPLPDKIYLSFSPHGPAGNGSFSLASGNLALITCMDAHVVELKNDTCEEDFFVRLITSEVDPAADPSECGPAGR